MSLHRQLGRLQLLRLKARLECRGPIAALSTSTSQPPPPLADHAPSPPRGSRGIHGRRDHRRQQRPELRRAFRPWTRIDAVHDVLRGLGIHPIAEVRIGQFERIGRRQHVHAAQVGRQGAHQVQCRPGTLFGRKPEHVARAGQKFGRHSEVLLCSRKYYILGKVQNATTKSCT